MGEPSETDASVEAIRLVSWSVAFMSELSETYLTTPDSAVAVAVDVPVMDPAADRMRLAVAVADDTPATEACAE